MRFQLLAIVLLAGTAAPAIAQRDPLDRRVGKLEQQMQAVQRRVFPGGNIEPEIRPEANPATPVGTPASSAVADLTQRVDALESQLATLTGQSEQNAFRLRQLEEAMNSLKASTESRLAAVEASGPAAPPQEPAPETAPASAPVDSGAAAPSTGDPAEDAYLAGFRLWDQGRYADAAKALEAVAKKYPKHRRASYAANLAGRAYLDDNKPTAAAKTLLANYQSDPKGERAADSLFFLGEALVRLKKPADACKVYDVLQDVYGTTMRDFIKQRLPKARTDANCG